MKERLPREEFYAIVLDSLSDGFHLLNANDIKLEYSPQDYALAKQELMEENHDKNVLCYEDVLMKMLKMGKTLSLRDLETDDVDEFTLESMYDKSISVDARIIEEILNEEGDAITYDHFIQCCVYGELVYG
jgi:hypothetical protein